MMLDPRHLAQLAAIVDAGSFSAAAAALGMAQPALSRNIKTLEESVGAPVLVRGPRRTTPTGIGNTLAEYGRVIRAANHEASFATISITSHSADRLRVAATRLIGEAFLIGPLTDFVDARDRVACQLRIGTIEELIALVSLGECDLAIGHFAALPTGRDLHVETLANDHMAVIARGGHPILQRNGVDARMLSEAKWIVPWKGSLLRWQAEVALKYLGVEKMSVAYETPSTAAILALLRNSDCLAVMPRFGILPLLESGLIAELPGATSPINRRIGILTHVEKRKSPLINAFCAELVRVAGRSEPS